MAGNSSRRGAVRASKKGSSVGSGGKGKAKLTGKGPTPKATERPHHPAAKAKARAAKKGGAAGSKTATGKAATGRGPAKSVAAKTGPAKNGSTRSGSTRSGSTSGTAATSRRTSGASTRPGSRGTSSTSGRPGSRQQTAKTSSGRGQGSGAARSRSGSKPGHDWVSGRNAVLEALQAGVPVDVVYVMSSADVDDRIRDIISLTRTQRLQLLEVSRTDLDRMTLRAVHQGVAARMPSYSYREPADLLEGIDKPALIVAVDGLTDPRNLGAILRSAAAFGATGVVIPQRRAVGVTPATWKTSAGAAARVQVAQAGNLVRALQDYKKAGCFVIGLAGDSAVTIDSAATDFLSGPSVIVVGAEGAGLSRLVRETCDVIAAIPIDGATESLNAAVATSIALYEAARIRRS